MLNVANHWRIDCFWHLFTDTPINNLKKLIQDGNGSSTAYLVTGAQGHSPSAAAIAVGSGADSESHYSLAHATRVSPATVRFVKENLPPPNL